MENEYLQNRINHHQKVMALVEAVADEGVLKGMLMHPMWTLFIATNFPHLVIEDVEVNTVKAIWALRREIED